MLTQLYIVFTCIFPFQIVFGLTCVTGAQLTHLVREGREVEVQGGIDFSNAEFDEESGKKCIMKNVEVDSLNKEPILQCTHQ